MKQTNKADDAAEPVEGRASVLGNTRGGSGARTQSRGTTKSPTARIRQRAMKDGDASFDNLFNHLDVAFLWESFEALKRNAAAGLDDVRWADYQPLLLERLPALVDRLHSGQYKARPARLAELSKPDGGTRTLSIQTLEDKIVQQAVSRLLEAVFDCRFMGFSYGFRAGRSQHDALDALYVGLERHYVQWVLDMDIKRCFDCMDHEWMLWFIGQHIKDKRILRLLVQWLKAGHIDANGKRVIATVGIAQGSVISPLMSNIYLHYVLDVWVQQWRQTQAQDEVICVRYADDSVMGFASERDLRACHQALSDRLLDFGLTLNASKTRTLRFGKRVWWRYKQGRGEKPETFDFLGFTHFCSESRKGKRFKVGRIRSRKRQMRQLKRIGYRLMKDRHKSIEEQFKWLKRVIVGTLNYFAVPGNMRSCSAFVYYVGIRWFKALRRRSQRWRLTWELFAERWCRRFPKVRVLHPYPNKRFDVKHSA